MRPRSDLSQDARSNSKEQPQNSSTFSPTNSSGISKFFNPRGPIRPQILVNNDQQNNSQSQNVIIPQARDFIRGGGGLNDSNSMMMSNSQARHAISGGLLLPQDEEYGAEDDDYFDEDDVGGGMIRQVDPIEERKIIIALEKAGQHNPEFLKVLDILQKDDELKPLIIEHQTLLAHLKDMRDVKAEYMLSILTAAETEMLLAQALQKPRTDSKEISVSMPSFDPQEKEKLLQQTQTAMFESEKLRKELQRLELEKFNLTQELSKEKEMRENLEREKECTFKNLYDENQLLKKMNETLKKNETETKKAIERREQEFKEEMFALQNKLKNQEDLRLSMLQNKSKLEMDLKRNQQFIENLEKEIQLLEKENENVHRKMNSTYNSVLIQSQINNNYLMGLKSGLVDNVSQNNNILNENTPARRNLSSSFQASGLIDKKESNLIGQPVFGYGQSTQKLKLLMSENNKSQGGQSFIAHSIYYGLGGIGSGNNNQQNNIYFQRNDSLVRSNSIEVILLDDEESKKQNMYILGEEEKQPSNASGFLTNKQSWFKTKGLFTDLSPINSISSHQMDPSTSRQNQQRLKKLHEVEEEHTEILGTHQGTNPYPHTKYYEDQVKKLQQEIERLKEENQELTQKIATGTYAHQFYPNKTNESPYKQYIDKNQNFATPQNSSSNFMQNYQRGTDNAVGYQESNNKYQRQILNTNNINPLYSNEQSPMMMATFSNQKDRQFYSHYNPDINNHQNLSQQSSVPKTSEQERQRIVEEYNEKIQYEFSSKIQDIGQRLLNLLKRFQPAHNEVQQYLTQEFNISLIKELISDILNKVDGLIELSQSRPKSGGVMSQGVPFPYIPSTMGMGNMPFYQYGMGPGSQWGGQPSSFQNSTTMEQTPLDLKNMFLEEKERRLQIQEELQKTKEHIMKYQTENERLKTELNSEKHHNQTMIISNIEYQNQNNDNLVKNLQTFQQRCEVLGDENVSLKLKVSELESELLDERQKQQIKYEFSIENLKNNMYGQYFDHKLRYEEQLMSLKEEKFKLTTEIQALIERNQVLKEQLISYRDRITELEKENINHSKENYILQNELDYETLRASQLQNQKASTNKTSMLAQQLNIDKSKYEDIIAKLEVRLKDLQYQCNEWELKAKKSEDLGTLTKIRFEDEIYRLKSDNSKLIDELKALQEINKRSSASFNNESNQLNKVIEVNEKKIAALKFKNLLIRNQTIKKLKGFYKLMISCQMAKKLQITNNLSANMNDSNQYRIQQFEEQLFKISSINSSLTMIIGKILRYINYRRPIKADLSGLINKQVFDYILYGLKNNTQVTDLNLTKNQLDDDDLYKLSEVIKFDQAVRSLKLGHNRFANIQPLLDVLLIKGKQIRQLDISFCQINEDVLDRLPSVISQLEFAEELSLSGIINQYLSLNKDRINAFINSIVTLPRLKALDLSKNKLSDESIIYLFNALKNNQTIDALALSSIGINETSSLQLVNLVKSLRNLKRFNLSGNRNLTSQTIEQILIALKQISMIEELDLSKCNISTTTCMQALASLMITDRKIRQLSLQRIQLGDSNAYYLIQPLSECLNIEVVRLDFNLIGPTFIEKLVNKMIMNKLSNKDKSRSSSSFYPEDSDNSFIQGNDDDVNSQSQSFSKQRNSISKVQNQGLITLSLEGNNIGDRGAKALADLIKVPNENSKKLKMINLNECGISNIGYEELRNTLMERGNLALNANVSHVKITIERNNINC